MRFLWIGLGLAFLVALSIDSHMTSNARRNAGYNPMVAGEELARREFLQNAESASFNAKDSYEQFSQKHQTNPNSPKTRGEELALREAVQEAKDREAIARDDYNAFLARVRERK